MINYWNTQSSTDPYGQQQLLWDHICNGCVISWRQHLTSLLPVSAFYIHSSFSSTMLAEPSHLIILTRHSALPYMYFLYWIFCLGKPLISLILTKFFWICAPKSYFIFSWLLLDLRPFSLWDIYIYIWNMYAELCLSPVFVPVSFFSVYTWWTNSQGL